jgi:hypothetical protein
MLDVTVLHLVSLFTLHVSVYMAIFRCVGCFIFVFLMESASLVVLARGYTLHVCIRVFLINFAFPCVCVRLLAASGQQNPSGTRK